MSKDEQRDFKKIWEVWTTERVGDLWVNVSSMKRGEPGLFWDVDELQEDHIWVKIGERVGQGAISTFLSAQRAACYQRSGNFTGKYHPNEAIRVSYDPNTKR
ncbi:hypothetical protein KSF_107100 [Reticulibacter mediterranei]|uniref:Uncharacterized protein n=1 Tax=Reticulibacter mediterranei TaxID=2778369 RepID=A0A8J3J1K2_9CHLR|nr:hypothetical protein [Reticulibacter mediterranei]GHP00663.1 hypothetical protein KSF_107100 [Reticulibacter mediterranei]